MSHNNDNTRDDTLLAAAHRMIDDANMPTPAWKKHAIEELEGLRDRIAKLKDTPISRDFLGNNVVDNETFYLLNEQLSAMILYEVALSKRINK